MNVSSRILVPVVLVAGVLATAVHAQQPATATAVDVPPMKCDKPNRLAQDNPSSAEISRIQKEVEAYKNCVNSYAKLNADKAQALIAQANAYRDAANNAIGEYNDYATELNARSKQ